MTTQITGIFSSNQKTFDLVPERELENSLDLIEFLNECSPRLTEQWVVYAERLDEPGRYDNAGGGFSHDSGPEHVVDRMKHMGRKTVVIKRWSLDTKWTATYVE